MLSAGGPRRVSTPGPSPLLTALPLGDLRLSGPHRFIKPGTADTCLLLDTGPGWLEGLWGPTWSGWGDELEDIPSQPVHVGGFLRLHPSTPTC